MAVETDRDVKFVEGFFGQDRFQKGNQHILAIAIDMKIGIGETKDGADFGLGKQHSIDEDAIIAVVDRQDHGDNMVINANPADDIAGAIAKENRLDDLDSAVFIVPQQGPEMQVYFLRNQFSIAVDIFKN